MEKNRNPNAAEIALPLNVFPVQSGFREKGKENDLAAVNIDISISIPAPKNKNKNASRHSFLAETNWDWCVVGRL